MNRVHSLCCAIVGFACLLLVQAAIAAGRSDDSALNDNLRRGEIEVAFRRVDGQPVREVQVSGIVNAPVESVWAVLQQFKHYDEFMPRFAVSLVLRLDAATLLASASSLKQIERQLMTEACDTVPSDTFLFYNRLDMPSPVGDRRYVLKMVRELRVHRVHWTQTCGDFRINEGSWQLYPVGNKTLAVYTALSDPGINLPGFIKTFVTRHSLPDIIVAVRKRAEEQQP
jgi:hypothetical protein